MKRTFVVPEDKEQVYEKFKSLVPEVSAKLVELMEGYVDSHEARVAGMELHTTSEGVNDTDKDVFSGKTFKFKGVQVAEGVAKDSFKATTSKVYLTLKGKLLVSYAELNNFNKEKLSYRVFETYDELVNDGNVPKEALDQCSKYLSINSDLRHFEMLDV